MLDFALREVTGIEPHDCRRMCAKLWRAAGGQLVRSRCCSAMRLFRRRSGIWERQDLVHAPNDGIKQRVAV